MFLYAKEREARIAAENRLAEERQSKDELLEEWRAERQQWQEQLAEERRRADEQRRRADDQATEQRRVADANQQVLLTTVADLTERISELAARNRGNGSANEP